MARKGNRLGPAEPAGEEREAKRPRVVINDPPEVIAEYYAIAKRDGHEELAPWLRLLMRRREKRLDRGARPFSELRAQRDALIAGVLALFADIEAEAELEDIAATEKDDEPKRRKKKPA